MIKILRHLPFIILFIWSSGSFAQDSEWRTINSVTEWLEEINNWPEPVYRQENLEILFDHEKDKGLVETTSAKLENLGADMLFTVNKSVRVTGFWVRTDRVMRGGDGHWFTNIQFDSTVVLSGNIVNRIGFVNCHFKDNLIFRAVSGGQPLWLHDCTFDKDLRLVNLDISWITMGRLHIKEGLHMSNWEESHSVIIEGSIINTVFMEGKYTNVSMKNSQFDRGIQLASAALSQLVMQNSSVTALDIQGTVLPPKNTYIPFDSIMNKLCTNLGLVIWRRDQNQIPYRGNTKEEMADRHQLDQLIASYYVLLDVYRARGDMNSYNACYIEMRDKMTARSRLLYEQNPNFNRYFDYQINKFTRAFSDYGTRPAKAIVIFLQVVLAFSIFYFFFPSDWNTTNSRSLMKRLSYLGSYFISKEGLSELYEKETKNEYKDYEEFKTFMQSSEKELPVYFKWLSKPLYKASVSRFNVSRSILRRTDILNGKWNELPKVRKALTSFVIGTYLLLYLIYILIVRCLNAITLSLNAFSTLGFGEIPTRGLARYVTIIQGFLGWFLLSIFLVSLIGQILN